MAYAFFSEPVNGSIDVHVIRDNPNRIGIRTDKPLTDEQMEDLYWAVSIMYHTGLTLRDILNRNENNVYSGTLNN